MQSLTSNSCYADRQRFVRDAKFDIRFKYVCPQREADSCPPESFFNCNCPPSSHKPDHLPTRQLLWLSLAWTWTAAHHKAWAWISLLFVHISVSLCVCLWSVKADICPSIHPKCLGDDPNSPDLGQDGSWWIQRQFCWSSRIRMLFLVHFVYYRKTENFVEVYLFWALNFISFMIENENNSTLASLPHAHAHTHTQTCKWKEKYMLKPHGGQMSAFMPRWWATLWWATCLVSNCLVGNCLVSYCLVGNCLVYWCQ